MIPLQVMLARTPQLEANATSLAAVIPISIAAGLVYYFGAGRTPDVDLRFAVLLMLGGVVGAFLGARVSSRIPERELSMTVAVVLGLVGLKELLLP
jgi:uncharacterized membrane protein YfcA